MKFFLSIFVFCLCIAVTAKKPFPNLWSFTFSKNNINIALDCYYLLMNFISVLNRSLDICIWSYVQITMSLRCHLN